MRELLESLSAEEQHAVRIIQTALDLYNTRDGVGFFTGPARYAVLEDRVRLVALQSQTLFEFWSRLAQRMGWPVPSKGSSESVLPLLSGDDRAVLRALYSETASVVMLARALHDAEKTARREQMSLFEEEA